MSMEKIGNAPNGQSGHRRSEAQSLCGKNRSNGVDLEVLDMWSVRVRGELLHGILYKSDVEGKRVEGRPCMT